MNYADLELGTWYPEGGMNALAGALENIAKKNGVQFLIRNLFSFFRLRFYFLWSSEDRSQIDEGQDHF